MDLDANFFATLNGVTYKINSTDFYSVINNLISSLSSGEPISTNSNPTPDQVIKVLQRISSETSDKMQDLRSAAGKLMNIYEKVTKQTIGVAPGSGTRNGAMMLVK